MKIEIDNLGEALLESLLEGAQSLKKNKKLVTSKIVIPEGPPIFKPIEIKRIRLDAHLTIPNFAKYLAVSVRTVEDWESGKNKPLGPARRLMELLKKKPNLFSQINVDKKTKKAS